MSKCPDYMYCFDLSLILQAIVGWGKDIIPKLTCGKLQTVGNAKHDLIIADSRLSSPGRCEDGHV